VKKSRPTAVSSGQSKNGKEGSSGDGAQGKADFAARVFALREGPGSSPLAALNIIPIPGPSHTYRWVDESTSASGSLASEVFRHGHQRG
jgi:hypothetical protein